MSTRGRGEVNPQPCIHTYTHTMIHTYNGCDAGPQDSLDNKVQKYYNKIKKEHYTVLRQLLMLVQHSTVQ